MGGRNIETILTKKDPLEKKKSVEKLCPLCRNNFNTVNVVCNTNNVGYRWVCNTCKDRNKTEVYEGEIASSASIRGYRTCQGSKKETF